MSKAIAILVADSHRSRLGLASRLNEKVAGRLVLEHTLGRVARVKGLAGIALVHPLGALPLSQIDSAKIKRLGIAVHEIPAELTDEHTPTFRTARAWATTAWRGGLGGATVYDELLPAAAMVRALEQLSADSALMLGADWMLVDPLLCQRCLDRHLAHPNDMAMTFTQAPPGLCGLVMSRSLLTDLAGNQAGSIGRMLTYNPQRPQGDPIGKDVCLSIEAAVRNCNHRFIYDTPWACAVIDGLARSLGDKLIDADAMQIAGQVVDQPPGALPEVLPGGPMEITLELTTRRLTQGPVTRLPRIDAPASMDADRAVSLLTSLDAPLAAPVMLGYRGDALLHEDWHRIALAARQAGALAVGVYTDLLVEPGVIDQLLDGTVDLVTVQLNADSATGYRAVMGVDRFAQVIDHVERLVNHRMQHAGMPWLVPRLAKTAATLGEMEMFFDRWMHFAQHAVIEPAMDDQIAGLTPPSWALRRRRRRQLIMLADGSVAVGDQRVSCDTSSDDLSTIWRALCDSPALTDCDKQAVGAM